MEISNADRTDQIRIEGDHLKFIQEPDAYRINRSLKEDRTIALSLTQLLMIALGRIEGSYKATLLIDDQIEFAAYEWEQGICIDLIVIKGREVYHGMNFYLQRSQAEDFVLHLVPYLF